MTRPLPSRPHLDPLRREARQLQRAFAQGDVEARERVAAALPRAVEKLNLADAQWVVAREYGFASWARLKLHVEAGGDPVRTAVVAARVGDAGRLAAALKARPELAREVDAEGNSLLHHACGAARKVDRVAVMRMLLAGGADPNLALDDGATPLHFAAQMNLTDAAAYLLDHGADPDRRDRAGGTPLHHALFGGGARVAELLAARGPADDNLRTAAGLGRLDAIDRHLHDGTGGQQRTWWGFYWWPARSRSDAPDQVLAEALEYAVTNKRVAAAQRLVAAGARFNQFAAQTVVTSGPAELVELWLSTAPELAAVLDWGWPCWTWAQFAGHEELGRRLKRLAAPAHLPTATDLGRLDLALALLAGGADPDQTNHQGTTALGLALGARSLMPSPEDGGSAEVAARLLAAGAHLDVASAAKLGRLAEVEALIASGADRDKALAAAVSAGQVAVVDRLAPEPDLFDAARLGRMELLTRLPADFDWRSQKDGDTLLDRALESGSVELVAALLARGAPVCGDGYQELAGKAAVHVAAWAGAKEAIWDLLLEHGADINHPSDPGTPYDCARMARHPETMALIAARGGRPEADL